MDPPPRGRHHDDFRPNHEEGYAVDRSGHLVSTEGRVVVVEVRGLDGRLMATLDVAACETFDAIHQRTIAYLWERYRADGYSPRKNAAKLGQHFPTDEALGRSLERYLGEHAEELARNRYPT